MKYLKIYKLFESDDSETMARFQLFGADATMAFDFNGEYFTDKEEILDLIKKYNYYYNKESTWSGGPSPSGFIDDFNTFYSKKRTASKKTFYPTVDLMIETPDYGTLILGFSVRDKSYKLINWGSLKPAGSTDPKYDENVLSEITKYVKAEINKLKLDEVIDLLQLNVKNKVDW
jgi:hypothetical protein